MPTLVERLETLRSMYGDLEPPFRDPFSLIIWETVAYLVSDVRRRQVFDQLVAEVGIDPASIAAYPPAALAELIRDGGMQPERRAEKLQNAAAIVLDRFGGDASAVLKLPVTAAIRELKRFPGIGEPGAEKILLFCGAAPLLALESNGLRVLLRLGYGTEQRGYSAAYRSSRKSADPEIPRAIEYRVAAHLLLRRHGQELCKAAPLCERCPLTAGCAYFRRDGQR